ncbi:phosphate regulon transcriptional regulatory protein PhoB [bacterium BMS3Abin15]|nr:phosphate regulon transcriptional regulatory protein PhoB [bacterium BMS3Abin15]HDZ85165.1 response regulator [Candidatus Moranbacteria bacterium]
MPKILIVEDDPMISEIYQKKFEAAGFEVVVAVNGNEVISNVKKDKFDLVLLDLVLPEMSGIDILKQLKEGKYNPGMKVVIFSNLSEKEDRDRAAKNGADGFISKTQYSPSELVKEIQKIIK